MGGSSRRASPALAANAPKTPAGGGVPPSGEAFRPIPSIPAAVRGLGQAARRRRASTSMPRLKSTPTTSSRHRGRRISIAAPVPQPRSRARLGLGGQVEEVEGAAGGRRQVGDDRRDDRPRGAGDHEHGVTAELETRLSLAHRTLLETDGEALSVVIADLDHPGVAQGLGDQQIGQGRGLAAGSEVDDLDQGLGRPTIEHQGRSSAAQEIPGHKRHHPH